MSILIFVSIEKTCADNGNKFSFHIGTAEKESQRQECIFHLAVRRKWVKIRGKNISYCLFKRQAFYFLGSYGGKEEEGWGGWGGEENIPYYEGT